VGLAAALIAGAVLARDRRAGQADGSRAGAFVATLAVVALLAVLTQVGASVIAQRFGATPVAMANRLAIWQDTLPVLREFWLTGTGAGTYLIAMAVYQRSSPGVIFNQAHNHYLQVAAEGGVLVAVPVALAIAAFIRAASRSLVSDRSGMFWIRAGAAAGLCGVAVQSVWETGLTLPANAAMAAVVAAIVVHVPRQAGPEKR
jgi:putative inorganic carbon (HCO3(-)) transporter